MLDETIDIVIATMTFKWGYTKLVQGGRIATTANCATIARKLSVGFFKARFQ